MSRSVPFTGELSSKRKWESSEAYFIPKIDCELSSRSVGLQSRHHHHPGHREPLCSTARSAHHGSSVQSLSALLSSPVKSSSAHCPARPAALAIPAFPPRSSNPACHSSLSQYISPARLSVTSRSPVSHAAHLHERFSSPTHRHWHFLHVLLLYLLLVAFHHFCHRLCRCFGTRLWSTVIRFHVLPLLGVGLIVSLPTILLVRLILFLGLIVLLENITHPCHHGIVLLIILDCILLDIFGLLLCLQAARPPVFIHDPPCDLALGLCIFFPDLIDLPHLTRVVLGPTICSRAGLNLAVSMWHVFRSWVTVSSLFGTSSRVGSPSLDPSWPRFGSCACFRSVLILLKIVRKNTALMT